jgi:transcriptional regulator with XRE-family HTH domain
MSEDLARTIQDAIRGERHRLGITQAELGQRLGMSAAVISKMERGDRSVLAAELPELCAALGITLDRLFQDAQPADLQRLGL